MCRTDRKRTDYCTTISCSTVIAHQAITDTWREKNKCFPPDGVGIISLGREEGRDREGEGKGVGDISISSPWLKVRVVLGQCSGR